MKIETKHNFSDELWYMSKKVAKPMSGKVYDIKIKPCSNHRVEIEYQFFFHYEWVDENDVYLTKQELLDSL